jgi:hypothetical protein
MNLLEQLFETTMFGEPYADFRQQGFGDVDRAGLAPFLKGQVLAGMQRPAVPAVAGRPTAAMRIGPKGGGQNG